MPNGQMPILQIGNKTMFQSLAICRYLAKKIGLSGVNEWEDAEIDMVVYTVTDLRLSKCYLEIAHYFYQKYVLVCRVYYKNTFNYLFRGGIGVL